MKKYLYLLIYPFLNQKTICKYDLHDWYHGDLGYPWHMVEHKCKFCNKGFYI